MARSLLLLLLYAGAFAGTSPKPKPAEYPARSEIAKAGFGAEYLVRSVLFGGAAFHVADFLVIEVAVYPARGERLPVTAGQFTLRINGRKQVIFAEPPPSVAASLKYPDWERRGTIEAGAGLGNAGVIVGRPTDVARFPGDRRPAQDRIPQPPRAPDQIPAGVERTPRLQAEEAVTQAALPEGETAGPVSGYLYFYYRGKPQSVRKLELLYGGPAGETTLRLLP